MFFKKYNSSPILILGILFIVGFLVRIYGLDWDNGNHLHPDERFLTMVASTINFPQNIFQYFNTTASPLNPYNYQGYQFFVYGTFPIFLVKLISSVFNADTYQYVHLFGRVVSAFFDSLNIIILYLLSVTIIKNKKYHLLASLIYAFTVLPIQLSHFFAVDTFLTTLLLTTFLFLVLWIHQKKYLYFLLAALVYGLAAATKISAILFSPVIILFCVYYFFTIHRSFKIVFSLIFFGLLVFIIFRVFQPYAFRGLLTPNPQFISSLKELNSLLNNRSAFYPPEVQYLNKTPFIYPMSTLIFWGLGLPFGLTFITALIYYFTKLKQSSFYILITIFWIIFLLVEQGFQFTIPARYFLPAYPFIALLIAAFLANFPQHKKILFILLFLNAIYVSGFLSIYNRPHSRVQASEWIYQHVPTGSNLVNENWDDPLPLSVSNNSISIYNNIMLSLYDPDTDNKWTSFNEILSHTNYLILSSNRLWGSISQVPFRYPQTSRYYQNLFDEQLSFQKLISFHSYPGFNLPFIDKCFYFGPSNYPTRLQKNTWFSVDAQCAYPGIYFRDDTAEESFTVYDHPQVIIFSKK